MYQVAFAFRRHLYTLFLFTKSDIKATLVPISIAGSLAAPVYSVRHFIEEFLWIWLHLLQFTTSNQSCSLTAVEEDTDNKPDRPIPSGRMTLVQVRALRWALVPVCFWISSWFGNGVLSSSVILTMATIWYNELNGGGRHWFTRNVLNGIGFASFESGAVLLSGRNRESFDLLSFRAILVTTYIFATTTHAQDFKDVIGDSKVGRSTIAIDLPRISRPSMLAGLAMWSIILSKIWDVGQLVSALIILLGFYVGGRYTVLMGRRNDQVSFYWYNLWLTLAFALPGIHRYRLGYQ